MILSNVSQWPWMTTDDKFQRHSFKLTSKLKVKSVRGRLFIFYIFEEKNELLFQVHTPMRTSASEPEPEPEPPKSFIRSRSRSLGRNISPEPEPQPEPESTKNVTAPHPCRKPFLLVEIGGTWRHSDVTHGWPITTWALICLHKVWNCCPERYGKFQSEISITSWVICETPQGALCPPPQRSEG